MRVQAVLFDVGGPLDTEDIAERLIDEHIRAALAAEGVATTDEAYAAANRWAVDSFAWNTYQAIVWRLTGGDVQRSRRVFDAVADLSDERLAARNGLELRAGIPELLADLADRGVRLGLAANQPASIIARLDRAGISRFFSYREVSAIHGYRKPDVRLFLRACDVLDVQPSACVMVGDRIDNDIAPARLLGMRTVLFRTGRHLHQQSRSWEEIPDVEVNGVAPLRVALLSMLDGGRSATVTGNARARGDPHV
jgi:HAD superfamily hydrolase (TIGR01549 family)